MSLPQSQVGDWSLYNDNPFGATLGFNAGTQGIHPLDPQALIDARDLGLSRLRLNITIDSFMPTPGTFQWAGLDALVLACNQNGFRVTLIARGYSGATKTAYTDAIACDPSTTPHYFTLVQHYTTLAVALCTRYSGDGNPANAKSSDGKRLQIDNIELGNEEFDVFAGTDLTCRNPLRYVFYARTVIPKMRASVASGGGGWIPRGNFPARVGMWGQFWQNQTHIQHDMDTFYNPPTDATWNASGDHTSIIGFNPVQNCQMIDYVNFHNYNNPAQNVSIAQYGIDQELQDIRAKMISYGDSATPIWVTEFGADGPCAGATEAAQSTYYAANTNGTGVGALSTLMNNGAQHCNIFTLNYNAPGAPAPYTGEAKSIACKDSATASGYIRFLAYSTIQHFITANPTWPFGFSGGGGGGGGGNPPPTGGTLSGAFAPLGATTVNLTTEGTGDWAHWGVTGTVFDHKATGGTQVSDASVVGNATKVQNPTALNGFTYTDGTPNATETATATGIKVTPPVSGGVSAVPHVMMVALENHSYNNTSAKYVVGNPNMPHINSLLSTYSSCTHFYGDSHPSLPNYLAFASGSDYGIANDTYNPATAPLSGNTLVDSLKTAGIAWKHYAEGLPSTGYLGGDTGSYVQHHNPWVYFKTIRTTSAQYNRIVNYTQLATDLAGGTAPPFIFVQPNNNDNGHNSSTDTTCDNFVNSLVATVQASTWYTANSGIIILWWDESNPDADTAGIGDKGSNGAWGGHIACCVISAANSGATLTSNLNHYGVLRALEKLYGLPYLGDSNHTINGDLTPLLGTTTGSVTTSNLGNGFKITAPADTNPRTLKVYTDVNQGIGTLAASLSDGSAPDFYDSSLTDSSGGLASSGVYTLVYSAAATGKLLNVTYTLSDNKVAGVQSASDTFTRANQSNLGTASDGETYTLVSEVGSPVWSIFSNQAKLTGSVGDTGVAILGTHTLLDCESVGIVNLSNTADSAGLVLRANTGGTTYYRASLTGGAIVLAYVTGGTSTVLSSQPATLKTNTNYWLRFRACKSSLYAKYWPNDGSKEPAAWSVFITDTTLGSAGKFGLRGMIGAASDSLFFDTFSVVDLSATGDPSYVSLYAADLPTSVTTTSGSLSASTSTPAGTIDLTAEGTGDWAHWGYSSATAFDHKSAVTQQISNFASIGSGAYTQDSAALLAYTWSDGTPDASVIASTTGSVVQGAANGFSFTVPADTTARTLNVYVQATKAQGQLTATLSDASASAYADTSLNDSGTGAVKKYTITYNAASANQTLTVQWTMLTDNGGGTSTTTYSTDTFIRANQSGWGTASSGGETWVQTVIQGTPTESILSNKGKVTSTNTAIVVSLLGTQMQANAEALVRFSISNLASDTASLIVRATTTNTFYRLSVTGGNTLQFVRHTAGVDTTLSPTATISVSAGTLYWIRFRVNGSNLYGRFWADGASEPTSWTITTADTSGSALTGAGQWGIRTKSTNGDSILYDSYTVTSIPSGGTPGSIDLHAATAPGSATPPPPPPPPPPPNANTVITVNATDALTPQTWIGLGVQQDAYLSFPYRAMVLSDGAVAYYRAEEVVGTTAYDATAHGYNGMLTGVITYGRPGATTNGNALGFGGSAALSLPSTLNPSTWTALSLEFWINLTSGWQYVIVTCDNTNGTTYYLNGSLYTSGSGDVVIVDQNIYYAGSTSAGDLDEVALYDYVLTPDQISSHFAASTLSTTTGISDSERALVEARLNFMNPSFLRTCAESVSWWCPSGVAGTYDFTNALMEEWYTIFDNAQQQNYSVIVGVNSPVPFDILSADWCTAFADLVNYLINTLGYTCIRYVSGLSEPDTSAATYANYKNTIEPNLVAALSAKNLFNYVQLIGPDTTMANDSWLTSAASDLSSTLSGYARHAFPTGATDISGDGLEVAAKSLVSSIYANDATSKPIIQAEMGDAALGPGQSVALYQYGVEMADYVVQLARAGMAALVAYLLDDDMHGTQWGMWQISTDTGQPRPWFFPWSVLTRALVPGSTIYAPAEPTSNDVRVLVAVSPQGGWTVVLVNRRASSQTIRVSVPFAPVVSTPLYAYTYTDSALLFVDTSGFPLASGTLQTVLSRGFTVSVAANSVLILTQATTVETNVFDVKRAPLQKRR